MSILRFALIALLAVTLPGLSLASGAYSLCTMNADGDQMTHEMTSMDGRSASHIQVMSGSLDNCSETICVTAATSLLAESPLSITLPTLTQGTFDLESSPGFLRTLDCPWRPPRLI